ncbi:hypothetical protein ABZX51_009765 [Aspergillus tubingensis]
MSSDNTLKSVKGGESHHQWVSRPVWAAKGLKAPSMFLTAALRRHPHHAIAGICHPNIPRVRVLCLRRPQVFQTAAQWAKPQQRRRGEKMKQWWLYHRACGPFVARCYRNTTGLLAEWNHVWARPSGSGSQIKRPGFGRRR